MVIGQLDEGREGVWIKKSYGYGGWHKLALIHTYQEMLNH